MQARSGAASGHCSREKPLFVCPVNTPFEHELKSGEYIVAWRIFGASNTKYKITFDGVSDPTKPVERKIHDGELVAAAQRAFTV